MRDENVKKWKLRVVSSRSTCVVEEMVTYSKLQFAVIGSEVSISIMRRVRKILKTRSRNFIISRVSFVPSKGKFPK
jgi:hypothetical protein